MEPAPARELRRAARAYDLTLEEELGPPPAAPDPGAAPLVDGLLPLLTDPETDLTMRVTLP